MQADPEVAMVEADARPPVVGPAQPETRQPLPDVLRGFAVLGILAVNIHFMTGDVGGPMSVGLTGVQPGATGPGDWLVGVLTMALATGKFMPSLALLFGAGTVLMADRASARGADTKPLLRRRYRWLVAIGLAHLLLLFPGVGLPVNAAVGVVVMGATDAHVVAAALATGVNSISPR